MKKFFIILIAAALILTLFACGKNDGSGESSGTGEVPSSNEEATATEQETEPASDSVSDPAPGGDAAPAGGPEAADNTVVRVVRYTDPDGKVIREETVPATGHVWVYESDESGHKQVCALCGATGESGAHDLDGSGVCRVCGYGCEHSFTDSVVSPGCTSAGYTVRTCSKCGYTYSGDYVKAAGHRYAERVETPATSTESGALRYTCAVCGEFFIVNDAIPATGHNYVNGVCVNCGESEPQEITVLPPDEPDPADDTEEESPPPFWTGEEFELPEVPIGG